MDSTTGDDEAVDMETVEAELLPIVRSIPWTRGALDVIKRQLQFTADIHAGYVDESLGSSEPAVESRDPYYVAGPPGENETEAEYADRVRVLIEKLDEGRVNPPPADEYD